MYKIKGTGQTVAISNELLREAFETRAGVINVEYNHYRPPLQYIPHYQEIPTHYEPWDSVIELSSIDLFLKFVRKKFDMNNKDFLKAEKKLTEEERIEIYAQISSWTTNPAALTSISIVEDTIIIFYKDIFNNSMRKELKRIMDKFYMVFVQGTPGPTVKQTRANAEKEAERLASQTGKVTYILEAIEKYERTAVTKTVL